MQILEYDSGAAFLERAAPQLTVNEAFGGLMYGIARRADELRRADPDTPRALLANIETESEVRLLAVMTPPHRLILHGGRDGADTEALTALAEHLPGRWEIPGLLGPKPLAEAFAGIWSQRTGARFRQDMGMEVYELRQVRHRGAAPGRLRPAGEADRELLEAWMWQFHVDAHGREPRGQELTSVARRLPAGDFRIWEDEGRPVSVAASTRPTLTGIAINAVYTPAELRGRGYATTCVAALCQALLDEGYAFCTLFADLENPTSNGIYRRIGFQPLGPFVELDAVTD